MDVKNFKCPSCGKSFSADFVKYRCSLCGSQLDVEYNYEEIKEDISWNKLRNRKFSHKRYIGFYPSIGGKKELNHGCGGTPILESVNNEFEFNFDLKFKIDSINPSGSFKDRGSFVEIGKALNYGVNEVVLASTGNMGASVACYSARAGLDATIFVPEKAGGPKIKQMNSYGANVKEVKGGFSNAAELAWRQWEEENKYLVGDYPFRGEGEKSLGFELADQTSADVIILPIGNGALIDAVWKAYEELAEVNLLEEKDLPTLVGVQAKGCNTVVKALKEGSEVRAIDEANTVAGAIACADPLAGEKALDALKKSDGKGIIVSDQEIIDAKKKLAKEEGIYAEEAGAAAYAGILKETEFFEGKEVVCCVTGHGLKT